MLTLTCALGTSVAGARDASKIVTEYQPLRPVIKETVTIISPDIRSGHVVVKFRRGLELTSAADRLGGIDAAGVKQLFSVHGLGRPEPLVAGEQVQMQASRMAAEDRTRMNLPDMSLYFRHKIDDPIVAATLIAALNARSDVEIAYFEPRPEVASYPAERLPQPRHSPYAATVTPSWEGAEDYIEAAPGGVDARAAWELPGGDGTGTRVIDIEYGWQWTHEDLSKGLTAIKLGGTTGGDDHGTAVMGEMVGDRNSYGVTGIAYNANIGGSTVSSVSFAQAMNAAALASDSGDCVLIELHAPGPRFNFQGRDDQRGFVPMEYFQGNFDAILNAYALGVIVCEAAGNGGEDLDDPIYTSFFDPAFRYSHAIMCGAGNPPDATAPDRSKLGFSNWGQRVDLQGYGTLVFSTGYGDLYNGGSRDSWYTGSFGGTSSASPIVTGAVLCISGVHQQMLGGVVGADSIRNLLMATGSPQQNPVLVRHIGPRPDLRAALSLLFDPTDSIWYDHLSLDPGQEGPIPVILTNSHALNEFLLPFNLSGTAPIQIDSLTRGPRTEYFETLQLTFDNRFFGQASYQMRANAGGGASALPGGTGIIAYLWVTAKPTAIPGQTVDVDSAWFAVNSRLKIQSSFQEGYPDAFSPGSVTITGVACNCAFHGDIDASGSINVLDVVGVINVAFRNGDPAPTDPACPHATRADLNCDEIINVLDVVATIDIAFRNDTNGPCDPCGE